MRDKNFLDSVRQRAMAKNLEARSPSGAANKQRGERLRLLLVRVSQIPKWIKRNLLGR